MSLAVRYRDKMMDYQQQFSQVAHPPMRMRDINPPQQRKERQTAASSAADERYSNNNYVKFPDSSNGGRTCSAPTTPTTRKANEILKSRRRQQHASIIVTPTNNETQQECKQTEAIVNKRRHHPKQPISAQQHQHERKNDARMKNLLQQRRRHLSKSSKVAEEHNGRKYMNKGAANRSRTRDRGHPLGFNVPSNNYNRRDNKCVDEVSREVDNNNANVRESNLDRQHKMQTKHEGKQRHHQKNNNERIRHQQSRRRNDNRIANKAGKVDDCANTDDHCDDDPKLEAKNCITDEHQSDDNESTQSQSSLTLSIRSEEELRMQRRSGIKIETLSSCNEEEGCETIECKLIYEEIIADNLYQYHFSNRLINEDDNGSNNVNDTAKSGEVNISHQQETNSEVSTFGRNGWHRMLGLLSSHDCPKTSSASANGHDHTMENNGRKAVVNTLANTHHAPLSEKQALQDEYEKSQREIESLERDRLALEREFYESEAKKRSQSRQHWIQGHSCDNGKSYRDFREQLQNMKEEDLMSIPSMLWMEDVQLDPPQMTHRHNRRRRHNNGGGRAHKNKDYYHVTSRIDPKFRKAVQEHRGIGLAVLIADTECHDALIKDCRKQSRQRRRVSEIVDGKATLIHEGGKFVRYCCITGQTKQCKGDKSGTSYFIKFDEGKSYHHGLLPSNLLNRLERENKSVKSIRYLSTGPLMACSLTESDKGLKSYYLEFDSGECWWNVPACNNEYDHTLERLFSDVDVHRVAFGRLSDCVASAAWVVIGKDGSVYYRNIPEGLHDFLTTRHAEQSHTAPCEVSLGISGSYFIRCLDGSLDYNLPKFSTDALEKLETQGSYIRNVSLHVDTADCLIRFQ